MTVYSEMRCISHNLQIPALTTVEQSELDDVSIRDGILDPLSDGDHHASEEIPSETVLPDRDGLQNALETVESYLRSVGCAVTADAHLRGLAAAVHLSPSGIMYIEMDTVLFEDIIRETLSGDETVSDDIVSAVTLAHSLEYQATLNELDITPTSEASWARGCGQQTTSTTGVIIPTVHPVRALETDDTLPERALGLVAGIQNLTTDVNGVYSQEDIAAVYLHRYLTSAGMTKTRANDVVSTWYEMPQQCLSSLLTRFKKDVIEEQGLPSDDAEFRYYLTRDAYNALVPASITGTPE